MGGPYDIIMTIPLLSAAMEPAELDDLNRTIIHALQDDARGTSASSDSLTNNRLTPL